MAAEVRAYVSRPLSRRGAAVLWPESWRQPGQDRSTLANVLRRSATKVCGAVYRARLFDSFVVYRQVFPPPSKVSAPVSALAATGRALPGCPFAEDDPALGQIVRRHLDMHAVTNDRSDTVTAHFPGRVGDDAMLIIENNAEASIGQDLVDRTFHRNELFLRQSVFLAYKKSSARTHSGAEPKCMKRKWCRPHACALTAAIIIRRKRRQATSI